jgi:hypothetical protein
MRVSESGLEPDLRKIWPVPGGDWESWLKLLVDKKQDNVASQLYKLLSRNIGQNG